MKKWKFLGEDVTESWELTPDVARYRAEMQTDTTFYEIHYNRLYDLLYIVVIICSTTVRSPSSAFCLNMLLPPTMILLP